jgi:hypothetical protein
MSEDERRRSEMAMADLPAEIGRAVIGASRRRIRRWVGALPVAAGRHCRRHDVDIRGVSGGGGRDSGFGTGQSSLPPRNGRDWPRSALISSVGARFERDIEACAHGRDIGAWTTSRGMCVRR